MASLLVLFLVLCSCSSIAHGADPHNFVGVPAFKQETVCSTAKVEQEQNHGTVSVPLVHRHGPCAPRPSPDKPSFAETLRRNSVRSSHILSRASRGTTSTREDEKVIVPTYLGDSVDSLEYVVTVGFGTPAVDQTVLIDTGSDVSWVQCKPCNSSPCSSQKDPLFDPRHSSTYRPVPCNSDACRKLTADAFGNGCTTGNQCRFAIVYADGTSTTGVYSKEKLTLAPRVTVKNFHFGCGHDQRPWGKYDGLLGLGRLPESLVAQTSPVFGSAFSYCLPADNSRSGFLALGVRRPVYSSFMFTPMGSTPLAVPFYVVTLTGVTVGGEQLDLQPSAFAGGMIIDSGKVVTGLPSTAYKALRSAFRTAMSAYTLLPNGPLEICYNLTGYKNVVVPRVALTFSGGATINLDVPNGVLVEGCLAFEESGPDAGVGVIGNVNQRNFEVLYDIGRRRVGFRADAC